MIYQERSSYQVNEPGFGSRIGEQNLDTIVRGPFPNFKIGKKNSVFEGSLINNILFLFQDEGFHKALFISVEITCVIPID